MNQICSHKSTVSIYQRMEKRDPTRTVMLRRAFMMDMRRRFRKLQRTITQAVVDNDVFGLQSDLIIQQSIPKQFAFPRSADKVSSFMRWLEGQVDREILTSTTMPQVGTAIETAWTDRYIADSYKRGVIRSNSELLKAGYVAPRLDEAGLQATMNTPFHMDRVGLLYSRVYEDLKGITSQMDTQISRVLAQGMADGDGPRTLARKMNAVISGGGGTLGIHDTLGRFIPAVRRAETLARTEVIRAHHQAMIREYENWAVAGVRVKAEWSTAADDRVCDECESMEGHVFSLQEISNMIPRHANCRCIALPVDLDAETDKQPEVVYEGDYFEQNGLRHTSISDHNAAVKDYFAKNPDAQGVSALHEYTGNAHQSLNAMLREGKPLSMAQKKMVQDLDRVYAKVPRYQGVSYRGIDDVNVWTKMKPGSIQTMDAYASSSFSRRVAEDFGQIKGGAHRGNRVIFEIKGKNGVLIENFSSLPEEREILFNRGAKFKVIEKTTLPVSLRARSDILEYFIKLEEI